MKYVTIKVLEKSNHRQPKAFSRHHYVEIHSGTVKGFFLLYMKAVSSKTPKTILVQRLQPIREGDKCFICSGERDKGGRLYKKLTNNGSKLKVFACSRYPECLGQVRAKKVPRHEPNRVW